MAEPLSPWRPEVGRAEAYLTRGGIKGYGLDSPLELREAGSPV